MPKCNLYLRRMITLMIPFFYEHSNSLPATGAMERDGEEWAQGMRVFALWVAHEHWWKFQPKTAVDTNRESSTTIRRQC